MAILKLLFIHGAGATRSKWRKLKEGLDRSGVPYSFIDLPGHGQDTQEVPESIEEFAYIIRKEIGEDTIIIGHSMGGLIGIEVAAGNPYIKGLILVGSHYELPVHPKVLDNLSSSTSFPESFFRASYAQDIDYGLLDEERNELTYNSQATIVKDFISCANYKSGRKKVSQMEVPILAVYGTEDRLIPNTAEEDMLAIARNITTIKIEGAGHYLNVEKGEGLLEVIISFYKCI
ncbi:alpha/beta fold hydrolase [Schinkia sp. CFF1]